MSWAWQSILQNIPESLSSRKAWANRNCKNTTQHLALKMCLCKRSMCYLLTEVNVPQFPLSHGPAQLSSSPWDMLLGPSHPHSTQLQPLPAPLVPTGSWNSLMKLELSNPERCLAWAKQLSLLSCYCYRLCSMQNAAALDKAKCKSFRSPSLPG